MNIIVVGSNVQSKQRSFSQLKKKIKFQMVVRRLQDHLREQKLSIKSLGEKKSFLFVKFKWQWYYTLIDVC